MEEKLKKIKSNLNIYALLLSAMTTLVFPQLLNDKGSGLVFSNSVFSVLFVVTCYVILKKAAGIMDWTDRRGLIIAAVLSFSFSLAMLLGTQLDRAETLNLRQPVFWVALPVLTCFFGILLSGVWNAWILRQRSRTDSDRESDSQKLNRKLIIGTYVLLLLCWLPVFLAVYPGFFVYDAQDEYLQVATRCFTTHHPISHVLLLGGIICAVHKVTDSYNKGIACYTILQMLFAAGGFSYLLCFLRKKGISRIVCICSFLYFAFFPVIVMFALCSAKDTVFTVALLSLVLAMLDMGIDTRNFLMKRRMQLFFIGSAMVMMLFRNNGVYAFVVMIPILLCYFAFVEGAKWEADVRKKFLIRLLFILFISVAGYFCINKALCVSFHASDSENQEILTVPIQQLARTYKFCPEVFSEEDKEILHEILSEEALERYNARLSDPVKIHFDNAAYSRNKTKYVKLWLRIGLKKPLSYLNAWLMTSYGYWYPDTVINVYSGNTVFTFTYQDSSYFGYEVEEPGKRNSQLPWLDEVYRKLSLELTKEKLPVVSMLFSPGFLFWSYVCMAGYLFYRKKYHLLLPFGVILPVWLTVILGPTYLPRYVLIFWFALPLFVAMVLEEERFAKVRDCDVVD